MSYEGRKVLITGGTGMIGSHLAELLLAQGAHVRVTEHQIAADTVFSSDVLEKLDILKTDLTKPDQCEKAVAGIDDVFHLAATLTGVMGNVATPVHMFTPNILMQTNMIEAAHKENVSRYLLTSSACIYSSEHSLPFKEDVGLLGQPDKNNEAHAWAKRMGEVQAGYYAKEYGMTIALARPFNSYGPRDNFHLTSSHVIASLIKKALHEKEFRVWGSGDTIRDFVYVTDTARALHDILDKHAQTDPINIASGQETTIKELAELILKLTGRTNDVIFESDKPQGQDKRIGSTEKLRTLIGFTPEISLEEGLKKTIEWYKENQNCTKAYSI